MAQDDNSSNSNEQWVKSEALSKVKPDAQPQEGSAKVLAEVKAQAAANPDDRQVSDLLAKLEQPEPVAVSPGRGGAGLHYGLDGKLHESAEKTADIADQGGAAKPPAPVVDVPLDEKQVRMARAYVEKTPQQAVAEHPELAKVYAARAAAETQLEGRPPESRQIVMARFDERAISQIEQGKLPTVQMNEKSVQAHETSTHEVAAGRERQLNA